MMDDIAQEFNPITKKLFKMFTVGKGVDAVNKIVSIFNSMGYAVTENHAESILAHWMHYVAHKKSFSAEDTNYKAFAE